LETVPTIVEPLLVKHRRAVDLGGDVLVVADPELRLVLGE
jgi:hypothetical protein